MTFLARASLLSASVLAACGTPAPARPLASPSVPTARSTAAAPLPATPVVRVVPPARPNRVGAPKPPPAVVAARPAPTTRAAAPTYSAWIADLAARACSGEDPDLAPHADMLAAAARAQVPRRGATYVGRLPDLEQAGLARQGRGTAFATLAVYVEPRTSPDAVREVYLRYDRLSEWTGRPGVRLLRREGEDRIVSIDAVRAGPFGTRFGARWLLRATPLDRGAGRLIASRQAPDPAGEGMLETRTLFAAHPDVEGTRVVEVTASVVEAEAPGLIRALARSQALREVRERVEALRARVALRARLGVGGR